MFYHDHAYGITRLNVYAGEAAGYLLTDPESRRWSRRPTILGTLGVQGPSRSIDPGQVLRAEPTQLAAQDPTWITTTYGGYGNLWFPHVYMPNQNPDDVRRQRDGPLGLRSLVLASVYRHHEWAAREPLYDPANGRGKPH